MNRQNLFQNRKLFGKVFHCCIGIWLRCWRIKAIARLTAITIQNTYELHRKDATFGCISIITEWKMNSEHSTHTFRNVFIIRLKFMILKSNRWCVFCAHMDYYFFNLLNKLIILLVYLIIFRQCVYFRAFVITLLCFDWPQCKKKRNINSKSFHWSSWAKKKIAHLMTNYTTKRRAKDYTVPNGLSEFSIWKHNCGYLWIYSLPSEWNIYI